MEKPLTKQAIFIIADISGYTQFMLSHKQALVHSQMIISDLLSPIVQSKEPPLEIAKLEGDAVFLFAVKEDSGEFVDSLKTKLSDWLVQLFETFDKKVKELKAYSICFCEACDRIDQLTLKIVVHSGEALFYKLGDFFELSGVDVIMLHRLLKNSVESDQYLLVTESASHDLVFPESIKKMEGEEAYDVGTIKTQVCVPEIPEYEVDGSLPFSDSSVAVEILRYEVRQEYCEVAANPQQGFHFHTGRPLTKIVEYPESWFEHVPERALESFAGTGNPFSLGDILPGEHVLDIGSGAGFDCFIAGKFVGPSGHVIGVDMTPEMLEKAQKSAEELGWTHVEFREGYAENLPLEDGWADVVISNGVISLSLHINQRSSRKFTESSSLEGGYKLETLLFKRRSLKQQNATLIYGGAESPGLCWKQSLKLLSLKRVFRIFRSPGKPMSIMELLNRPVLLIMEPRV